MEDNNNKQGLSIGKLLKPALAVASVTFLVAFVAGIYFFSTSSGTQYFIRLVNAAQNKLHFKYVSGSLLTGMKVDNIVIEPTSKLRVTADNAELKIGWKALGHRHVHLRLIALDKVVIEQLQPPEDKPFEFKDISLPLNLDVDTFTINQLEYIPYQKDGIYINKIQVKDTQFNKDTLSIADAKFEQSALRLNHAAGKIQFKGFYPLDFEVNATLLHLARYGLQPVELNAGGTIADLKVAGLTHWPQPLFIKFEAQAANQAIPFNALVSWNSMNWGFIPSQYKGVSKGGYIRLKGNKKEVGGQLLTDFDSTITKKVNLKTLVTTNFTRLDISQLTAQIYDGSVIAHGGSSFTAPYDLKLNGNLNSINSKYLSQVIQEAVPPVIQGRFNFLGRKVQKDVMRLGMTANLKGDEQLVLGVSVLNHEKAPSAQAIKQNELNAGVAPAPQKIPYELGIDFSWKNVSTNISQIGSMTLTAGQLKGNYSQNSGKFIAKTGLSSQGKLPSGTYQTALGYSAAKGVTAIALKDMMYKGEIGQITAEGLVKYQPAQTNYLLWNLTTNLKGLNVNSVIPQVPIKLLSGRFDSAGEQNSKQHTATIKNINLVATIHESGSKKPLQTYINGGAQAALLFSRPLVFGKTPAPVATAKELLQAKVKEVSLIRSFAFKYLGNVSSAPTTLGKTDLDVSGTPTYIDLKNFYHNGIAGLVQANGNVLMHNGPAWQLKANFNHLNPGVALSDWPGSLTGQLDTGGSWQTSSKRMEIRNLNANGTLRGEPVQARGSLLLVFPNKQAKNERLKPTQFNADHFYVSMAGNSLGANGNTHRLNLDINAPNLSKIHPSVSGQIQGKATISGDINQPDVNADINAKNLKYQTYGLSKGELHAELPKMGKLPGQVKVALSDLLVNKSEIQSVIASYKGVLAAHQLTARVTDRKTTIDMAARGSANATYTEWKGEVNRGLINYNNGELKMIQPAFVAFNRDKNSINVTPHCWSGVINFAGVNPVTAKMQATESPKKIQENASTYTNLNVRSVDIKGSRWCVLSPLEISPHKGNVNVGVENMDMRAISMFLPRGVSWKGLMNGMIKMDWVNKVKNLQANFVTQKGEITLPADEYGEEPVSMPYDVLTLNVNTQKEGMHVRFDGKTPAIGHGYVDAIIDPDTSPMKINGALVLDDVQVSILKPFFPQFRILSGTASWAGGMSGPLTGPDFYGEFNLVNGKLAMANDPIQLSNVKLHSSIRGTQATIDGQFNSGTGIGKLDGTANWQDKPKILLHLTGNDLAIRQAPLYTFFITPDLNFDIRPTDKYFNLTGTIDVPNGRINPQVQNGNDVVTVSPDVRVIDHRQQSTEVDRAKVVAAVKAWSINTDIGLTLGKNVRVTGFGTDVPLTGGLKLRQSGQGKMQAVGEIASLRPSRIEAYGQNMLLEHVRVNFGGPLKDGVIDAQASKVIDNHNFGIQVTGTVSKPKVSFYNDAGLSEQETINAILTGHTSDLKLSPDTTNKDAVATNIAMIGLGFGLNPSNRIANQVGRRFGVEGLAFGAEGTGTNARVNLSGYITPDLFIRYGVGVFTPVNKLTVRYQVTQRLYLEATSSLEKAVDLFYNWNF